MPLTIPGRVYTTGMSPLSRNAFDSAKVLDLSVYLAGLSTKPGRTIKDKVRFFLADKWEELASYDLYVLPTKPHALSPLISFVLVSDFLKRHIPLIVVDPVASPMTVFNLTLVHDSLVNPHRAPPDSSADLVEYILVQGEELEESTMRALKHRTGVEQVLHMRLGHGDCRVTEASITLLLHEFNMLVPLVKVLKKKSVARLWLVLDKSWCYSAYTAVAVQAFGLETLTHVFWVPAAPQECPSLRPL